MRLPTQKKISREDLKDAPAWISGIIGPVNSFMETVYQALNHNITLQENIASFIKEITYITPSTYPVMGTISIQNELRARPIGTVVLQAYDKDTFTPAPGPVYVPWVQGGDGSIIISPITGLEASKTYIIRLLVF